LNKLRAGISDTAAMGVLNDAVGQRLPVLVVPMISERLVDHPAWPATVDWLHQAGVTILDPTTGRTDAVFPLASGEGPAVAERFDPAGLTDWLAGLS
jgi:phosphopantothenoylcysteine synthetase/decarboxylase